jgi:hypothetical protein
LQDTLQHIVLQRGADAAVHFFKPCAAELMADPQLAAATVSAEIGSEIKADRRCRQRIKQLSRTNAVVGNSKRRRFSRSKKPLVDINRELDNKQYFTGHFPNKSASSLLKTLKKISSPSKTKMEEMDENNLQADLLQNRVVDLSGMQNHIVDLSCVDDFADSESRHMQNRTLLDYEEL